MRAVQILTPFFAAYAASAARVSQHSHGTRNDSVASLPGLDQVASFPVVDKELHAKAVEILERFKVTIAVPEDLYALQDYDVVVIADDSGSMRSGSRWKELQDSLSQIVEIGSVFDDDGLDIYFLNRPVITGVRSAADKHFVDAFYRGPDGSTPLTHTLDTVMKVKSPKPVLLFILTDGVPDKGVRTFKNKIGSIVNNKKNPVKVQMMACTDDDKAVGWFDELDDAYDGVDVTDDYLTEKAQILRIGKVAEFTRGDWCIKAMLGPISRKFDELDEDGKQAPRHGGKKGKKGKKAWKFR